jgi:hypothetical protein
MVKLETDGNIHNAYGFKYTMSCKIEITITFNMKLP